MLTTKFGGICNLRFSAEGYVDKTISGIDVGSGDAVRLDIALTPLKAGDLNSDAHVDLIDAILALQLVSLAKVPVPLNLEAEAGGDGKIGLEDAVFILRLLSF